MLIRYSSRFIRKLKKLAPTLQEEVLTKIELFKNPVNHRKLDVHKLHGPLAGSYGFSVAHDLRIIFDRIKPSEVLFLTIGTHDHIY